MKKIFTFIIFLSVMSAGVTPAVAAVDFTNGFETALYQYPNAVNNWHDPQPYPPGDRLTRVNFPVRTGNWSFKAMVLPGDSYGMSGERAELYGMYGQTGQQLFENENSGTHYYAVSVYLPPSWSPPVTKDPWEPFGIFTAADRVIVLALPEPVAPGSLVK